MRHEEIFTEDNFYKEIQSLRLHRRTVSQPKKKEVRAKSVMVGKSPGPSRLELWLASKEKLNETKEN